MPAVLINIDGKPVGKVILSPSGVPWIDPGVMSVLRHVRAPGGLLPILDPEGFEKILLGLAGGPTMLPGIGVLTTQRLG